MERPLPVRRLHVRDDLGSRPSYQPTGLQGGRLRQWTRSGRTDRNGLRCARALLHDLRQRWRATPRRPQLALSDALPVAVLLGDVSSVLKAQGPPARPNKDEAVAIANDDFVVDITESR